MRKIEGFEDAELKRLTKDIENVQRANEPRSGEAVRRSAIKVAPKLSENIRRNQRPQVSLIGFDKTHRS
jgi:hypothetical protein